MATGFASTGALFQVGKQTAKGTAATAYLTALAEMSQINARRDAVQQAAEHGIATTRTTDHKAVTQFGSYLVTGSLRTNAYMNMPGLLLLGAGFKVATTGATAAKTHTFKIANRTELTWLSILSTIGDTARRAVDCRVNTLGFEAAPDTARWNAGFLGLTMDNAAGTETTTAEDTNKVSPAVGSLVLTVGGTQIVNTSTDQIQRFTMDIANPLSEDERALFTSKRSDLPQTGLGITGKIEGLELDYTDTYPKLMRNGLTTGEPYMEAAKGSLVVQIKSPANIATDSVPYMLEITLGSIEVTLDDFQAESNNIVRWNTSYRMIDDVTDPAIIKLVNTKTTY